MVELFVVIGLVLVTSATCSLFEAVLYSVPASCIETLEQGGRPSGQLLKQLRQQVDRPIAAILSLNTIANTGGGAIAGALAATAFGASNVAYFSVFFTLAILIFSEVLPKTLGVVYTRRLAPYIAWPLNALVIIFKPLVSLMHLATALIWKGHEEHGVSDEELLGIVGAGLRSGTFKPYEARVIQNVLAFEGRTAGEVMTPRPVVFTLSSERTVREAAAMPELNQYSRIPVYDGEKRDDLVGVVHRVDILTKVASDRFDVKLETLMRPMGFVVETGSLDQLLRTFLERRQHLLAVIDEFGGFSGIVTLEDVLEELIGLEIVDESDQITDLREYAHQRREEILSRSKPSSSEMNK